MLLFSVCGLTRICIENEKARSKLNTLDYCLKEQPKIIIMSERLLKLKFYAQNLTETLM